jgi:hypothetical protein
MRPEAARILAAKSTPIRASNISDVPIFTTAQRSAHRVCPPASHNDMDKKPIGQIARTDEKLAEISTN